MCLANFHLNIVSLCLWLSTNCCLSLSRVSIGRKNTSLCTWLDLLASCLLGDVSALQSPRPEMMTKQLSLLAETMSLMKGLDREEETMPLPPWCLCCHRHSLSYRSRACWHPNAVIQVRMRSLFRVLTAHTGLFPFPGLVRTWGGLMVNSFQCLVLPLKKFFLPEKA